MPKRLVKKFLQVAPLVMLLLIGIAQAQVTLTGISPGSGQAGITNISLIGNGFPVGTPSSASAVTIILTPTAGGSAINITPLSVVRIGGGAIRRMMFQLPGPAPANPTSYNVSFTDATDGVSSTNTLPFTFDPAPSVALAPNSGTQGTSEPVTITGTYTNFLQGSTTATFPSGVTVTGLTVNSPTSATANITIAAGAATGTNPATVASGVQSANANFTVNAAVVTYTVSGTVTVQVPAPGAPLASPPAAAVGLQGVTINLDGSAAATTDVNGNYSIPNVSTGAHTLAPSGGVPAADSVTFYPPSRNIAVSGTLSGQNFGAQPGYTVSGTVSYSGKQNKPGQVYIKLQTDPPVCATCPTQGTSVELTTAGATTKTKAFTIHGVPPGTYTGQAWFDINGLGEPPNTLQPNNPAASPFAVTVTNGDLAVGTVTLSDPATGSPGSPGNVGNVSPATPDIPLVMTISQIDNGVVIYYPSVLVGGVEQALGYNVAWSSISPSDCESGPSTGNGGALSVARNTTLPEESGNVLLLDGNNTSSLFYKNSPVAKKPAHGQIWFFCLQGVNGTGAGGTFYTPVCSPSAPAATCSVSSGTAKITLAAAPTSNGAGTSTVQTNVTIPAFTPFTGNTPTIEGPLYTGCYDPGTHAFYVTSASESTLTVTQGQPTGSPVSYSIFNVPNTANCSGFAWVNQDNDGIAEPNSPYATTASVAYATLGDLFNLGRSTTPPVLVSSIVGALNEDLTNYSENSVATLVTQSFAAYTDQNGVAQPQSYAVNLNVAPLVALPGTVELQSPSPNVNSIMDFATSRDGFFPMSLSTGPLAVQPQVGDSYNLTATPLNNALTPDQWGSASGTCLGAPCPLTVSGVNVSFPTGLGATSSDTPTFSWSGTGPFQFTLTDTVGNVLWQVPRALPTAYPLTATSITYPTDPTGAGNTPLAASLTSGTTYVWSVSTIDGNGNLATQRALFTAP